LPELRLWCALGHHRPSKKEPDMAKSQKKSNKEVRKPKAEKGPKANASQPSTKGNPVGMTTIKN
jgi:hypothetical protein